jgi:hypothetical protein
MHGILKEMLECRSSIGFSRTVANHLPAPDKATEKKTITKQRVILSRAFQGKRPKEWRLGRNAIERIMTESGQSKTKLGEGIRGRAPSCGDFDTSHVSDM